MENNKKLKELPITCSALFRKLFTAWIYAAIVMYIQIPQNERFLGELSGYTYISPILGILIGVLVFVPLVVYPFFYKENPYIERAILFAGVVLLVTVSLMNSFSAAFLGISLIMLFLFLVYLDFGWSGDGMNLKTIQSEKWAVKVAIMTALAFFLLVSCWTVCRVKAHSTPTYDFGIFSQMFYSMKTHGNMLTTLERDETMSHLFVHVSFIYYLMLPFYFIISTPACLQVLQAAVLTSAFLPLWKLARANSFSVWEAAMLTVMLAIYPAFAGGTSYDLHENVFLTPLLLWLFYFIQKKSAVGIIISALLTLAVKEDAAVYVAVIALWLLVSGAVNQADRRWKLKTGCMLIVGAIAYFGFTTTFLATVGDGVMSDRYANFMYDKSDSLMTVIKAVLMQPMKVLFECVDADKLAYIGMTMGALIGIPLFTRKYERYILLIPFVLINLMPDYGYQSSIFMQYGYGAAACLFYLFIVNYSDIKNVLKGTLVKLKPVFFAAPIILSLIFFWNTVVPKAMTYMERYQNSREIYAAREALMDKIPADASVAASTFFTTYLSQRDEIYDIKHSKIENILSCDYILADYGEKDCYERFKLGAESDGYDCFTDILLENGYEHSDISEYGLDVYIKK